MRNTYNIKFKTINHAVVEKTIKLLKKNSFCVLKKFINKEDINYLIKLMNNRFKKLKEIRVSGPWVFKMKDFKRLDLGDTYNNIRFSRCITFFEWHKENRKFFKIIEPIIEIRNRISNINTIKKKLSIF